MQAIAVGVSQQHHIPHGQLSVRLLLPGISCPKAAARNQAAQKPGVGSLGQLWWLRADLSVRHARWKGCLACWLPLSLHAAWPAGRPPRPLPIRRELLELLSDPGDEFLVQYQAAMALPFTSDHAKPAVGAAAAHMAPVEAPAEVPAEAAPSAAAEPPPASPASPAVAMGAAPEVPTPAPPQALPNAPTPGTGCPWPRQ